MAALHAVLLVSNPSFSANFVKFQDLDCWNDHIQDICEATTQGFYDCKGICVPIPTSELDQTPPPVAGAQVWMMIPLPPSPSLFPSLFPSLMPFLVGFRYQSLAT